MQFFCATKLFGPAVTADKRPINLVMSFAQCGELTNFPKSCLPLLSSTAFVHVSPLDALKLVSSTAGPSLFSHLHSPLLRSLSPLYRRPPYRTDTLNVEGVDSRVKRSQVIHSLPLSLSGNSLGRVGLPPSGIIAACLRTSAPTVPQRSDDYQ